VIALLTERPHRAPLIDSRAVSAARANRKPTSPRTPRSLKVLGAIDVGILALALAFAVGGSPDVAAKLGLVGMLAPGIFLFGAILVFALRSPSEWHEPRVVVLVFASAGAILAIVPLLAWLPFAASGPQALPLVVAIPAVLGSLLFAAGALGFLSLGSVEQWRQGDRRRAVMAALFVIATGLVIVARLSHAAP
jgi:hypothetical protein